MNCSWWHHPRILVLAFIALIFILHEIFVNKSLNEPSLWNRYRRKK
jgi:hypothetical protein